MPTHCSTATNLAGPRGADGADGAAISPDNMPRPGNNGMAGQAALHTGTYDDFANNISIEWIGMLLHQAELHYLNGATESALANLLFLRSVLENMNSIGGGIQNPAGNTMLSGNLKDQVNAYFKKVNILIIQISQGLDYYGYYANHVPLLSIEVYRSLVDNLLSLGREIEAAYNQFFKAGQTMAVQQEQLFIAVSNCESRISALESFQRTIEKDYTDTWNEVKKLLNDQLALQLQVEQADAAFRAAVEARAACNFGDVIAAASALVSIGSGIGTIVGGIGGIDAINQVIKDKKIKDTFFDKAKYLTEQVRVIGSGLNNIKEGYNSVKAELAQRQDAAKLLLDESNFEETIKQFEDMPEAVAYRKVMREFVKVTNTRNEQVLHADALLTRLYEIDTEIARIRTEVLSEKGRLVGTVNPFTSEHITFFESAVKRTKADILRMLDMELRALSYWSLVPRQPQPLVSDRTVAYLSAQHASFIGQYAQRMEDRNQAPVAFRDPQEILFTRNTHPEIFRAFDQSKQFTFSIPATLPQYRFVAGLLVNQVTIRINQLDFNTYPIYEALLVHHGNPAFIDPHGAVMRFRHRQRLLPGFYNNTQEDGKFQLGGDLGHYAYLSPIATWSLILEAGVGNVIDTANITAIGLTFTGVASGRF